MVPLPFPAAEEEEELNTLPEARTTLGISQYLIQAGEMVHMHKPHPPPVSPHSPPPHVHSQQGEGAVKWWDQLFGDVVDSIKAESCLLQHLLGSSHQLDQRLPRSTTHYHIRYPLPFPGLGASVHSETTPTFKAHHDRTGATQQARTL